MKKIRTHITLAVAALSAFATAFVGSASPASAAGSSLTTTIIGPATSLVNAPSHFDVTVVNNGTAPTVAPWIVTVDLPKTNSAYGSYVNQPQYPVLLGTLGAVSPGCTLTLDVKLVCTITTPLSATPGSNSKTVGFDVSLPYITKPFSFTATATDDGVVSVPSTTSTTQTFRTVTAPLGQALVEYCGGSGLDGTGRRSFFECKVIPGLTMYYKMTLAPNGQVTNVLLNNKPAPTRGGTWSISGTRLDLVLTNGTSILGTMSLQGVSSRCWEGPLATAGTSPATNPAQYSVCL